MIHGFKRLMIVLFIAMIYAFSTVFYYYQKERLSHYQNKMIELNDVIKKNQKKMAEKENPEEIRKNALLLQFKDSTKDDIIIIDDEP